MKPHARGIGCRFLPDLNLLNPAHMTDLVTGQELGPILEYNPSCVRDEILNKSYLLIYPSIDMIRQFVGCF
jgi:hypothetical protein